MSRLQVRKLLLDQISRVQARDRGLKDVVRLSIWQLEATGNGEPGVLVAAARLARQGHEFALVRRLAAAAVDSAVLALAQLSVKMTRDEVLALVLALRGLPPGKEGDPVRQHLHRRGSRRCPCAARRRPRAPRRCDYPRA